MKIFSKSVRFLLLAVLAGFPVLSQAEVKIGFVDSARIMELSPQAQAFKDTLDREFEPKRNRLLKKQAKIKKLEEKLIRDVAIMSDSEKLDTERKIRDMKRDLRREQEDFSEDVTLKRNEELMKLQKEVVSTIQDYAEKNHFDLIINESVVVYASKAIDITNAIIKNLKSGK